MSAQPSPKPAIAPHFADPRRAWTPAQLAAGAFCAPLGAAAADELRARRAALSLRPLRGTLPALEAWALGLRARFLDDGPGVAHVRGADFGDLSEGERANAAWALLRALGEPMPQNEAGESWVAVRDEGQRMAEGGRYHKSNEGGELHTDGPQYDAPPRYVGLLCLRRAHAGGVSKLVSAHALHNALRSRASDALLTLYRPFEFHRKPLSQTTRAPIFAWDPVAERLRVRYLGEYVRSGHAVAQRPLGDAERSALAALDRLLGEESSLVAERALEAGDLLLLDNDRILHGRSAFEDAPGAPREMARIWLAEHAR